MGPDFDSANENFGPDAGTWFSRGRQRSKCTFGLPEGGGMKQCALLVWNLKAGAKLSKIHVGRQNVDICKAVFLEVLRDFKKRNPPEDDLISGLQQIAMQDKIPHIRKANSVGKKFKKVSFFPFGTSLENSGDLAPVRPKAFPNRLQKKLIAL